MKLVLASIAFAALALQPTVAAASGCYRGPFANQLLPQGCPITVYQETSTSTDAPRVIAQRDGANVDVTATVTKEPSTLLDVGHPEYDCDGEIVNVTPYPTAYDVYTVTVTDAIVGEYLDIGGARVYITPAAECPAPVKPEPLCGYIPDTCDEDEDEAAPADDGGCNAGGGAGLAAGLLALALVMRARR